jgi:hypothetical protein
MMVSCRTNISLSYVEYKPELLNRYIDKIENNWDNIYLVLPIIDNKQQFYEICINAIQFEQELRKKNLSKIQISSLISRGIKGVPINSSLFYDYRIDLELYNKEFKGRNVAKVLQEVSSGNYSDDARILLKNYPLYYFRALVKFLVENQFQVETGYFAGGNYVHDLSSQMRIRISKGIISRKELKRKRRKIKLSYSNYDSKTLDKVIDYALMNKDYILLPVIDSLGEKGEVGVNSLYFRDNALKFGLSKLTAEQYIINGLKGNYMANLKNEIPLKKVDLNHYILKYQGREVRDVLNNTASYYDLKASQDCDCLVFKKEIYNNFYSLIKYLIENNFRITHNSDHGIAMVYDLNPYNRIKEWKENRELEK